jgi:hypothetical protein
MKLEVIFTLPLHYLVYRSTGSAEAECWDGDQRAGARRGTMACTPFYHVQPGASIAVISYENTVVPAGDYCANTWRLNSNGTHTEIGHECKYIT